MHLVKVSLTDLPSTAESMTCLLQVQLADHRRRAAPAGEERAHTQLVWLSQMFLKVKENPIFP